MAFAEGVLPERCIHVGLTQSLLSVGAFTTASRRINDVPENCIAMMRDHCHAAYFLYASSHAFILDPFSAYPFEPHDLESDLAHGGQQCCPRPPSNKLRGSLSAARHMYLWYTKIAPSTNHRCRSPYHSTGHDTVSRRMSSRSICKATFTFAPAI